jgi:hypothetical protein
LHFYIFFAKNISSGANAKKDVDFQNKMRYNGKDECPTEKGRP